jgi:glycosyltransferase involved in cell wall biosynthesis
MEKRMKRLVSFRPGCIGNRTAYECQAMIYRYLVERHGYEFTIIKSEDDQYEDEDLAFRIVSIPKKLWQPIPRTHFFPPSLQRSSLLKELFKDADGILTVEAISYPQALLAMRSAGELGKPVWFDVSATTMGKGESFRWKIARSLIRPLLANVSGIIVTVPKCIERFQDLGIFSAEIAPKFVVMGHPVDTALFRPVRRHSEDDGILRVLLVSRLVPEKGIYYVIETMSQMLLDRSDIRLQILGDGPMKGLILKEAVRRGIENRIEFLPMVSHRELPGIVGAADIFVNHSVATSGWEEFFGVVNLEAMSCALPCVVSRCGGLSYAVRGDDVAIMVDERDARGLRNGLEKLIASEELRRQYGERAREYVAEYYDIAVIGERYRQMIEDGFVCR